MDSTSTVSHRLTELVNECPAPINDIAAGSHVAKSTILRIMSGEVRKPTISTLGSLAHYFNVDSAWLTGQQDQRNILANFLSASVATPEYFTESIKCPADQFSILSTVSRAFSAYYHHHFNNGVILEPSTCFQAERLFFALISEELTPINKACPGRISTMPAVFLFDHDPYTFNQLIDTTLDVFDIYFKEDSDYDGFPDLYEFSSIRKALIQYLGRLLTVSLTSRHSKADLVIRPLKSIFNP